ncbi:hypothetical protein A9P82_09185 [Arachidicoccus ginsenosidimutans]|uniref:TonB-dependent receptor n=1 Tax=Arachidicoccus sp. BS20 TaxID=1850526 RepID=UPI0007F0E850|nr:TonB-dependent receptor [Arachidicoccus sp. BS20]ANI89452.1 hypothetical protein A9P82_09185 [Arachidicoccus sp. BS20]
MKFAHVSVLVCLLFMSVRNVQAQTIRVKGKIINESGEPVASVSVMTKGLSKSTVSDNGGNFYLNVPDNSDSVILKISSVGYRTEELHFAIPLPKELVIRLQAYDKALSSVEVFGHPRVQPDKLDALTGLPLQANQQIQSVSVISNRLIQEQDNQDIGDALHNVTGVISFSSFGGMGNAYTIRGIRGVTTLVNGIQMNNDFRGHGVMPDMETVDNVQVLKGSSAIAQGVSASIGAVGGIINAVTKTPDFVNAGTVGIRYGSWDNVRGFYDFQHIINDKLAYRIDGAAQKGNGYRAYTKNDRFVINPSLTWKPDDKTTIIAELHYQHDNKTPDRGTVNLGADSVNGLWNIPNNKFLGFTTDHNTTDAKFWGIRLVRKLTDKLDFKINYYGSAFKQDFNSAIANLDSAAFKATGDRNVRYRYMNHVTENDKSATYNIALVGHDLHTGSITHTFQIGFDYRNRDWFSQAFNSNPIDTIDVFSNYSNILSNQNLTYTENKGRYYNRNYNEYGLFGQDMITFNKYLSALAGVRYSYVSSVDNKINTYSSGNGTDPIFGVFITPVSQLHFFGSYTTISDISTAEYVDENGKKLGNTITHQWEFGLKSSYFGDRLRFNFTYFIMDNNDYTYQLTNTETGNVYYNQSGSLKRNGIETEVTGHVFPNFEVLLGYTHLNAKYDGVKSFVDGAEPMGTAKNLANGWLNYVVRKGSLKGLSFGGGVYYVGQRPVDDYSKSTRVNVTTGGGEVQKITPGIRPFDLAAYTTINGQIAYSFKQYTIRAVLNNIGNSRGYTAYYPQAFLNPTDPRNIGVTFTYAF